jgi:hypothetical protein
MFGFPPGTCGWRTGVDGTESQRRSAQAARAERRAAGRRQQEEAAEADDSPWCCLCGNGLCHCQGRCEMCWCLAVVNLGLGLPVLGCGRG